MALAATWDIPLDRPPQWVQSNPAARHPVPVETYCLRRIWCLNLYDGRGELRIAESRFPILPGFASITVPNTDMEYRYTGKAVLTWVHFIPRPSAAKTPIRVMQDLGPRFDLVREGVREVCAVAHVQRSRAEARLWDVLWQLASAREESGANHAHPALAQAMALIESRLSGHIDIKQLSRDVDLSQTHLNRLFHAAMGTPVGMYIRGRRIAQARHLLQCSNLPIKTIAVQVGLPDPHHFNKAFRRVVKCSPREFRNRAAVER